MLGRKELKPFHLERWDLAHRATNYSRWATADQYYDIEYEHVSAGTEILNPYSLSPKDQFHAIQCAHVIAARICTEWPDQFLLPQ